MASSLTKGINERLRWQGILTWLAILEDHSNELSDSPAAALGLLREDIDKIVRELGEEPH